MEYTVENEYGRFTIVQDQKHGFWRVSPPPNDEFLREFYRQQYLNPTYSFHDELYADLVERWAPQATVPGSKVFEIGCGNGDKLLAFKSKGCEVYGFEPGIADYEACLANGLDVYNCPFDQETAKAGGPYSVAVLSNILEHVPDPEGLLQDIYPLVSEHGVLLIDVPNEFNALQQTFMDKTNERPWFISPPAHLNYFTPESLVSLLTSQGWLVHHRTTRFPMELFLLMGRNYVVDPTLGPPAHQERMEFEKSFMGGNEEKLWMFYDSLAEAKLGREIIVVCEKSPNAGNTFRE